MAVPTAYGSSWARGQIGAAAEAYGTATETMDPSHICGVGHSLWQCQILKPLTKTRDQIRILLDTMSGS